MLFFAVWATQAIDAHRRAVEDGATQGGAILLLALLPVAIVVFTGFWLVGGASATPAATLERFVGAWRGDQPAAGDRLLLEPAGPGALAVEWRREDAIIHDRILVLAATLGPRSGLQPARPLRRP